MNPFDYAVALFYFIFHCSVEKRFKDCVALLPILYTLIDELCSKMKCYFSMKSCIVLSALLETLLLGKMTILNVYTRRIHER